eukprot:CAMPEP_0117420900 /NCGR_PEP_ID=MMETSP0758-20121206/2135_1 /TAXON_ID=63605 /ORGANISM="Percolomonas cosmopolitus, Strain AE-1 (ATCC 50343)" /LENGTH=277 /DNA_ID=CAMNT_0005202773 /DNA_START=648 /DNA_END=1478 /DNA_ORIENTATION=+
MEELPSPSLGSIETTNQFVNLEEMMDNQQYILFGSERRSLQHLPKIVHDVCKRLRKLIESSPLFLDSLVNACSRAASSEHALFQKEEIRSIKQAINMNDYSYIQKTTNINLLIQLLFDFLNTLNIPVLSTESVNLAELPKDDTQLKFIEKGISKRQRFIVVAFLRILRDLQQHLNDVADEKPLIAIDSYEVHHDSDSDSEIVQIEVPSDDPQKQVKVKLQEIIHFFLKQACRCRAEKEHTIPKAQREILFKMFYNAIYSKEVLKLSTRELHMERQRS